MNFVADEGVDRQIVEGLRADGHTAIYIAEMDPGISDENVLRLTNQQSAILITADKDFGELVFRQAFATYGVLFIRLAGPSRALKAEMTSSAIRERASEIPNSFSGNTLAL